MTKNPIVWFQYLCWLIQWWMFQHKPIYPLWLRGYAFRHYGNQRYHMTWQTIHNWQRVDPNWQLTDEWRPLPWYFGVAAMGPFVKPWDRLTALIAKSTGGRSHRCEFTDRQHGALYGHQEGAFMGRLFEQFIADISEEPEDA